MQIPVEFEYEGKKYKGILSSVSGSASAESFQLYVNKFYCGALNYGTWNRSGVPNKNIPYTWRFTSQSGKLDFLQHVFVKALNEAGIEGDEYVSL